MNADNTQNIPLEHNLANELTVTPSDVGHITIGYPTLTRLAVFAFANLPRIAAVVVEKKMEEVSNDIARISSMLPTPERYTEAFEKILDNHELFDDSNENPISGQLKYQYCTVLRDLWNSHSNIEDRLHVSTVDKFQSQDRLYTSWVVQMSIAVDSLWYDNYVEMVSTAMERGIEESEAPETLRAAISTPEVQQAIQNIMDGLLKASPEDVDAALDFVFGVDLDAEEEDLEALDSAVDDLDPDDDDDLNFEITDADLKELGEDCLKGLEKDLADNTSDTEEDKTQH